MGKPRQEKMSRQKKVNNGKGNATDACQSVRAGELELPFCSQY